MNAKVYSGGKEVEERFFLKRFHREEVGIFETFRTYYGKIFKEEEHLDRLLESAKTSGFNLTYSLSTLRQELKKSLKAYYKDYPTKQDIAIRMTLFQDELFLLIGARPHPSSIYDHGVELRTSPVKRSLSNAWFPETKTSAYQNAVLASVEPRHGEVYEWLFLDQAGFVTEVRIGNIFVVPKRTSTMKTQELWTPPAPGILNGVTRRFVIECALQCKMEVKETPFTRHDIYNGAEVFLTNTSWEILPVSFLDGRKLGEKLPGLVTKKLHRQFKQRVNEEYS